MLSHKLIEMIERHSDQIGSTVIVQIRQDPLLPTIAQLPKEELLERGIAILRNFGSWLADTDRRDLAKIFEDLGRRRCQEGIPLHETVRALHTMKHHLVDFVRSRGFGDSPVEIYAEEELEYRVNRFFDVLVYHLVRGYEEALVRKTEREAAASIVRG